MRLPLLALATLTALAACAAPVEPPRPEPEIRRKAINSGPVSTPRPEGVTPYALVWKKNTPSQISVKVAEREETIEGLKATTYDFTYDPSPPDVGVELAAAAGTASFALTAVDLTWVYNIPGEPEATKVGPQRIPISPVKVTGAPAGADGIPFRVVVPLNVLSLKEQFINADKSKRIGRASAVLTFYAEQEQAIFAGGGAIKLSVPVTVILK